MADNESYAENFVKGFRNKRIFDDFSYSFYSPTQDPFTESSSGNFSSRPSWKELQTFSESRVGVGYRATWVVAHDAIRNKFRFTDLDGNTVHRPEISEWLKRSDFFNQFATLLGYERVYGIGFMISFYKGETAKDLYKAPPRGQRPTKFKVLSPLYMSPLEQYSPERLDWDVDTWTFRGGITNSVEIHTDRVYVLSTRPSQSSWYGVPVLEPIWTSLMAYYNCIIFLTKGIAKWGNLVPVLKMGSRLPSANEVSRYIDMINEMEMNGTFILPDAAELRFETTNIGAGINEIMQVIKEDISSGLQIPLNQLFGLSQSGGIGGEGALTSERNYMNLLGNIQGSVSDDVLNIIERALFDTDGLKIDWNLALQKTTEQRLREENLRLQNEMLRKQIERMDIEMALGVGLPEEKEEVKKENAD